MSSETKKRKREPTLAAPTLEEIGLPPARRQRTDASKMEDLSCEDVVESLREQGVGEDAAIPRSDNSFCTLTAKKTSRNVRSHSPQDRGKTPCRSESARPC